MICPSCGSEKVKVELRSAGTSSKSNRYRTGVKNSWIIPSVQTTRKSKRNYKSIALCQRCGYVWEPAQNGVTSGNAGKSSNKSPINIMGYIILLLNGFILFMNNVVPDGYLHPLLQNAFFIFCILGGLCNAIQSGAYLIDVFGSLFYLIATVLCVVIEIVFKRSVSFGAFYMLVPFSITLLHGIRLYWISSSRRKKNEEEKTKPRYSLAEKDGNVESEWKTKV